MKLYLVVTLLLIIAGMSCKKKQPEEVNPFTPSVAGATAPQAVALAPNFLSIYTNILKPQCANSSCHDGDNVNNFQPDLRSIESAYATLVKHPSKKSKDKKLYPMVVKPYSVDSSFMYFRLIDSTGDKMPLNGSALKIEELKAIKDWITDGAKNQYGQNPK